MRCPRLNENPPTSNTTGATMIAGLDGIRAIAFLLVFAVHTDYLNFGWVGVQLFFVLSGFLITGILLDMKEYLPHKEYYKKFYGRRLLRIFPLYYFYLVGMTGISLWLRAIAYRPRYMQIFLDQVSYAYVYLYDFFYASAAFQNTHFLEHFWSLSVEEQFYLVWPLLILITPKKHIKKLFLGAIVAGPLFRIAFVGIYKLSPYPFIRESMPTALYSIPFTHLDAFGFGAFITRFKFPRPKQQLVILAILLPVLGFATRYLATGNLGEITGLGYPFAMPKNFQYLWGYTVLNYFFALFIYAVVNQKLFIRFLELPALRYLGKISYGLYVYHFAIIWFAGRLRDVIPFRSEAQAKLLIALIAFALTFILASASYCWIEQPILNLKDRFFKTKPRSPKIFTGGDKASQEL
ncbi:MAG: acyltransferase [Anaerolineales bacterium]|nr:acyltransferase [Anaerolineales bacterium]